jgi:FAD dependent oxidoreductase
MFIDTTYEGDLVAAAGVETTYGREANAQYGETYNGNQVGVLQHAHYFAKPVDPYRIAGDPSSGLLPRIDTSKPGVQGEADKRIQAYCFRMCLTNDPENRIPFAKPDGYDPMQYELLLRVFESGWDALLSKYDPLPNKKTDTNNHGPFSTDNIGMNYDYPTATDQRRAEIIAEHERYQKGLMYFMANDSRVPEKVRQTIGQWGLCKDEFVETSGWPHQLYIREARRMVGQYVMTELDCLDKRETPDSVGMGSYTLDSHNVRRYVTQEGFVQNEGDIGVPTPKPYRIAYGSIVPKREECENLLVPVSVSSSHIAYGSIRMEPVFMILGQSAATAAVMAIEGQHAVQDLEYEMLSRRLLEDGQVLQWSDEASGTLGKLEGIVVDDSHAVLVGDWVSSTSHPTFYKHGYQHNQQKPASTARFEADLAKGRYEVRVIYPHNNNRTTAAKIAIRTAAGIEHRSLDQTQKPKIDNAIEPMGVFEFSGPSSVEFSTDSQDGFLVIDAVQFIRVTP